MNTVEPKPDRNSLGKASFIVGLIGLVLSFIPIIGFVSWFLAPMAILFGLIALRRPSRSLAIAGIVTGAIALLVCIAWFKGFSTAMNKDTFNTTGEVQDLSSAPVMDATITDIWRDIEANKVAAGQKYGGHRLSFKGERIEDFSGDAADPQIVFIGKTEEYLVHMVSASFSQEDGPKIGDLKKGDKVSFICTSVNETFGGGYSLSGCKLS